MKLHAKILFLLGGYIPLSLVTSNVDGDDHAMVVARECNRCMLAFMYVAGDCKSLYNGHSGNTWGKRLILIIIKYVGLIERVVTTNPHFLGA